MTTTTNNATTTNNSIANNFRNRQDSYSIISLLEMGTKTAQADDRTLRQYLAIESIHIGANLTALEYAFRDWMDVPLSDIGVLAATHGITF